MDSPNVLATLALAAILGLRHALDPDHLVAVSTLVAGAEERAARAAARLGATWGAGHALAVVVLGLPVVLAHALLPGLVERLTETAIGVIIVALAGRLLLRWRRGAYHAGTAVSMAILSGAFGWTLGRPALRDRFELAALPLGVAGLGFGALYAASAWLPALALA